MEVDEIHFSDDFMKRTLGIVVFQHVGGTEADSRLQRASYSRI